MTDKPLFRAGFVALVGLPNAGKSTLMNQLLQEPLAITTTLPQTTRSKIFGILTNDVAQIIFVDMPGIANDNNLITKHGNRIVKSTITDVDCSYFIIDVKSKNFSKNKEFLEKLIKLNRPVIVIFNKIDLVNDDELQLIRAQYSPLLKKAKTVIDVSALNNTNLESLLALTTKLLPQSPPLYDANELTTLPLKIWLQEAVRAACIKLLQDELPYQLTVMAEKVKMSDDPHQPHELYLKIIVNKMSQKGIVIGKGGKMIKKIREQATKTITAFLKHKVILNLFVSVDHNWIKSTSAVSRYLKNN